MNIVSEDCFRRHVVSFAEKDGYHVSHIESHLTSAGIPDLNLFKGQRDVWLELKIIKDGKVKLRPTQKKWHRERAEKRGISWVFVLDTKTQDILWLSGRVAASLDSDAGAWRAASNISPLSQLGMILNNITYRENANV